MFVWPGYCSNTDDTPEPLLSHVGLKMVLNEGTQQSTTVTIQTIKSAAMLMGHINIDLSVN